MLKRTIGYLALGAAGVSGSIFACGSLCFRERERDHERYGHRRRLQLVRPQGQRGVPRDDGGGRHGPHRRPLRDARWVRHRLVASDVGERASRPQLGRVHVRLAGFPIGPVAPRAQRRRRAQARHADQPLAVPVARDPGALASGAAAMRVRSASAGGVEGGRRGLMSYDAASVGFPHYYYTSIEPSEALTAGGAFVDPASNTIYGVVSGRGYGDEEPLHRARRDGIELARDDDVVQREPSRSSTAQVETPVTTGCNDHGPQPGCDGSAPPPRIRVTEARAPKLRR